MKNREYFKLLTDISEEASLNLPFEELEETDNADLIKFARFQAFKAKGKLYRDIGEQKITQSKNRIRNEMDRLIDLPIETLRSRLGRIIPQTQFRNLDKLDRGEMLSLIEDSLILEDLSKNNE